MIAGSSIGSGRLMLVTGAAALPALAVSWLTMSQARYPEWRMVERTIWESTAVAVLAACIAATILARPHLSARLPWSVASAPRSTQALVRLLVAVGASATLGWLLGVAPLLVWAQVWATSGHAPLLALLGGATYVGCIVMTSLCLVRGLQSAWVVLPVAIVHVFAFFLGRSTISMEPGVAPKTRFPLLPFDGIDLIVGGAVSTPLALVLHRVGGAALLLVATVALMGIAGRGASAWGFVRGVVTHPVIVVAVVLGGIASWRGVPIAEVAATKTVCSGAAPRVCLLAPHQRDLSEVVAVVDAISARLGPELVPVPQIDEANGPASGYWNIRLTSLKSSSSSKERVARNLAGQLVGMDRCLSRRPVDPDKMAAAGVVMAWATYLGTGIMPEDVVQADADKLRRWQRRPDVNESLRKRAGKVLRCEMTYDELP